MGLSPSPKSGPKLVPEILDLDNCEVCGEASDSAETIKKASELNPDLILIDVSMPGINGFETTRVLKKNFPQTKILIITQHDPKQMRAHSMEVGANGCVDKARLGTDLLPAIRALRTT